MCGLLTKVKEVVKRRSNSTAAERKAAKKYMRELLAEERCYGLPGTNGSFCSNFIVWTLNKHQILSLCFAHKEHPFGRCERFLIFLTTLMIGLFVSVMLMIGNRCETANKMDIGDIDVRRLQDMPGSDEACSNAQFTPWEQSLIVAAVLMPIDSILKALATCKCLLSCFAVFRKLVKTCGNLTICIVCSIGVIFTLVSVAIISQNWGDPEPILFSWFVGELQMQLLWFVFYPPIFCCLYNRHRKRFQEDNPGFVAIDERVRSAKAADNFLATSVKTEEALDEV